MKTFLLPFCSAGPVGCLLALLLLAAAPARAQAPANDDPTGAIVLPLNATCTPTAGTTAGATYTQANGYLNDNCGGVSGPGNGTTGGQPDVWYRFTTAATGAAASRAVRLTLTGNPAGLVRVFTTPVGSAGPFSEVRCASSGAANTAVGNVDLIGLQPATIYYLLVGGYAATDTRGPFTICVTDPTPCGDPQNVAISGIGATTAQLDFRPGNGNVSYTVVVTRQGGPPVTLSPAPTSVPIALTGLAVNSAYTVTLQATCANGGTSAVFTRTFRTTTPNDEPRDAILIPIGVSTCTPTSGTTVGATNSIGNTLCGAGSPRDVWYTIDATTILPSTQVVQVVVTGAANLVRLFRLNGSLPYLDGVACSSGLAQSSVGLSQTAPPITTYSITSGNAGEIYYIAVSSMDAPNSSNNSAVTDGPFTICVTQRPAVTCSGSGAAATINANGTVDINIFPSFLNNPASYTVTAVPQGVGATVVATAPAAAPGSTSVANLVGLTPGTLYTATIIGRCSPTETAPPYTATFITPYLTPANNQCSGATPINCGQTLAGTLNGAVPVAGFGTCGGSTVGFSSVYYTLTGTGTPITASLCSPNTQLPNNALIVLQGSCTNFTCIGANTTDPTCPTRNAKVTFASVAGRPYVVAVQSPFSGGFTGNFDLTATCAAPTCGAATGVAASAASPTSARVTFVAPVGGAVVTGYTVALTPASGPIITVPAVVASPVLVTGLLPNTAYTACVTTNCAGGTAPAPSSCAPAFRTPLASRNVALAEQLGLFPNPARQSATLTVPAALLRQAGLLTLTDNLGRPVQQRFVTPAPGRTADTRAELDLTGLPAGVYTLRLLSHEGPLVRRLVVE